MECGVCCCRIELDTMMVECVECQYQACRSCIQTYLLNITSDPHCMNCRQSWDILFIRKNLDKQFLEGVFKEHRKCILWKRSHRCHDQHVLCVCPSCPYGKIMKSTRTCSSCWIQVCPQCHQQQDRSHHHQCAKDQIQTLDLIHQTTKPCPGCHAPIEKTSGCFQMFCTHCNTAFDWKDGTFLEKQTLHNPHYFDYQKNQRASLLMCQMINNMTDYSLKWMCQEFYILVRDIGRQIQQHHLEYTKRRMPSSSTDLCDHDEAYQQQLCQYLLWVRYYRRGLSILRDVMAQKPKIQQKIQCFKNDLREILIDYNEHVAECVQLRGFRLFPCNPPIVCM